MASEAETLANERSPAVGNLTARPKTSPPSVNVTPDKGWAWLILVASFISQVLGCGVIFSFGVLLLELLDYYGEGRALTASVGSLIGGIGQLTGPIGGMLIVRFGCKITTIIGGLLSCVGFLLSTFSPNIYCIVLTYSVLGGTGIGLVYITAFVMVSCVFDKYRALATGIVSSGVGVGTFVFTPVYALTNKVYSWKGTMWIMAGVVLNCCVVGFLYRAQLRGKREGEESTSKLLNTTALKTPAFIVVSVTGFFGVIGYYVPLIFITDLVESLGLDRSKGAILISIMGISNMAGRVLPGIFINCACSRSVTLYVINFLIGGLPTIVVPWMELYPLLCGYSVCIGFSFGASVTIGTIILQEYLGTENMSKSVGFTFMFKGAAGISSGPLAGLLYKWTGNHTWMFVIAGLLITVAAVVALPLGRIRMWDYTLTSSTEYKCGTNIKDTKNTSQLSLAMMS